MTQPNILFLMSDEHRYDICGFGGNQVVRTPNLDRLAQGAVVFDSAYTPSPICIPGRQCLMSGQLPKTNNCQGWAEDLPPNTNTFARHFAQHAYKTVCAGKLHHVGIDQMQGWTKRIAADTDIMDQFVPELEKSELEKYPRPSDLGKWSNQKELERAGIGYGPYQEFDDLVVQGAKSFIRSYFSDPLYDRPEGHRPLLFKVSLLEPHYPYFAEKELFEYYLNRVPIFQDPLFEHPVLSLSQQMQPVNVDARTIRRATAAYYAMCESMDRRLGEVLSALEHSGQNLDEWIIVYTSDHGEMLGEHGLWEKTRFFEASVRVPLFIRYPKAWSAKRVSANVNLCDLYATLCDAAKLSIPNGLDSRSLVPLLEGNASNWNDESVSQMGKNHVMIKQGSLKYHYYGENIPEVLFDLKKDPRENINLISDFSYQDSVKQFRSRLATLGHGPTAIANYQNAGYTS
jgi:choline-sulfatase